MQEPDAATTRPSRSRSSRLARRPPAWGIAALVVVAGQIVMWRGWNGSGQWEPATGTGAVTSIAVCGGTAAVPVVVALLVLRRWLSLAAVLVSMTAVAVATGSFFRTSTSSTAGFAWFGPFFYGLGIVAVVVTAEGIVSGFAARSRRG